MGKGSEYIFFHRRHTDGQQVHEKMLNITNHQESFISKLTTVRMAFIKKTREKCW